MTRFILAFAFFTFNITVFGQAKFTFSGYIKEQNTGEEIIGAIIQVKDQQIGATTNEYGFFSLTLPSGKYTFLISSFGAKTLEVEIDLNQNTSRNIDLTPDDIVLKEVEITDDNSNQTVQEKPMSMMTVDIKKIKKLPALFGEVDVLKSISLLPGIQSAGEGNAGFYVRGGSGDQNLILLDEATVYNASHLFGFFSVFNSDAIKDIDVYKGGIPARYGGRLSSLLDVRMKDGNNKKFSGSGGLGLISSRLTLEGPIQKGKSSFIISGRRTYADLFLKLAKDESIKETRLYFYDFNAKANYRLSDKDRIFVSGYFGRDVLSLAGLFGFDWGNATGTLRWNHVYNPKLFSNLTVIYSNFNYGIKIDLSETQNFKVSSGINDIGFKADYSYFPSSNHTLYFGMQSVYHTFKMGSFDPLRSTSIFNQSKLPNKYGLESNAYIDHKWTISPLFNIRYGVRLSMFNQMGKSTEYSYYWQDQFNLITTDTMNYASGQIIKTYPGIEPRFAASYALNENISIKATYDHTYQFIHQVSNSATTLPTDLWIPSSLNVKPQINDQVAIGYFHHLKKIDFSVELYHRWLGNQIDFRDNAAILFNEKIDAELLFGKGFTYGSEFMISKNDGKFTGWIAYTLAWSWRQIEGINNGEKYPVKNDRRHNLNVVATYAFSDRFSVSSTFVFATGNAITFPGGKYSFDDEIVEYYPARNSYRMPNYNRMDLSVTLDAKKTKKDGTKKKFESSWNFSIYNVYSRENAFAIVFEEKEDEDGNPTGKTIAKQITLFKLIPSITWNFKF
jgi:hypothetical protein